jgi:hypothetical protein
MHNTLQLVANCDNFVTTNNNILGFLHYGFNGFDDNLVHGFNHLPANGVKLVLAGVLHL